MHVCRLMQNSFMNTITIYKHSVYVIAKIFFAYATLASFLLQFYVPMDFLEPPILERMKSDSIKLPMRLLFRTLTVLFIGQ